MIASPHIPISTPGASTAAPTRVENPDVILIGSDLSKLVETLKVARRCRSIITQNFVGTLTVDSIGVGMAAFGFLNPLLAAFIHVTSELAFILNSTRLLSRRSEAGR